MFDRIIAWFDANFVPDWRKSWKWPEIQLAAAAPFILGLAADNWGALLNLIQFLPENSWVRNGIVALVILALFIAPAFARLWNTEKPKDD